MIERVDRGHGCVHGHDYVHGHELEVGVPSLAAPSCETSQVPSRTCSGYGTRSDASQLVTIEFVGDRFTRQMVRNLVGTLVEVGRGVCEPTDISTMLLARDRTRAGQGAPAHGLILSCVLF